MIWLAVAPWIVCGLLGAVFALCVDAAESGLRLVVVAATVAGLLGALWSSRDPAWPPAVVAPAAPPSSTP